MKVDSINNNVVFGNKNYGVEHLRIIKEGKNLRFIDATGETPDVGVFVADGSKIDRKVCEAKLKIIMSNNFNKPSCSNHNSLWKRFINLLNFYY